MAVKSEIVVKFPSFSKNKDNKIEIHKNLKTQEEIKNEDKKRSKSRSRKMKRTVKISSKKRYGMKNKKKGGNNSSKESSLKSRFSNFFNITRKNSNNSKSSNDYYTYIFDKVETVNNNVKKMVDGMKIYKNDEHVKDVVLENNYISNLFSIAKQKFSRKFSDISNKFKSTKTKLIDKIRNATFIIKEDSTFYKYMEKAISHMKNHKRVYAVLAFVVVCAFVLFVPFTGIMLFTLVPFAFTYLFTSASVVFYTATGAINSSIIAPATAGFNSIMVTGSQGAVSEIANIATGASNTVANGLTETTITI